MRMLFLEPRHSCVQNRMGLVAMLIPLFCLMGGNGVFAAVGHDVFQGFTLHISQQIVKDKREFVDAQSCTEWFYQRLRRQPQFPELEKVSSTEMASEISDCLDQYPTGLDGARAAFSRTQSFLSLSLTFYQLALIGDRDDDDQYNAVELRDLVESFGMMFTERLTPGGYVTVLNEKFDSVRLMGEFNVVTTGMESLYKKGYRFTKADQAALNREAG